MKALKQHLGSITRGLALSIAAGCAYTPPFQPKDDYAQYPGYEKDIALYNLQGILTESCEEYTVSPQGIYCEVRHCRKWSKGGTQINPVTKSVEQSYVSCEDWDKFETRIGWEEMGTVEARDDGCVLVEGDGRVFGCSFYTATAEKAQALKKAMDEYRGR